MLFWAKENTPAPEMKVNAERQTTYSTKYGGMTVFCALDDWMDLHIRHLDAFKGQSPYLPACYMTLKAVEECQFISSVSSSAIDDR